MKALEDLRRQDKGPLAFFGKMLEFKMPPEAWDGLEDEFDFYQPQLPSARVKLIEKLQKAVYNRR